MNLPTFGALEDCDIERIARVIRHSRK